MLVFDIGANIGEKSAVMRAKGARVVCFEPQPQCAAELRRRFHDDPGVTVVEMALGRSPGRATLSICDDANAISTLSDDWKQGRFKEFAWSRQVDVEVNTLDWAIAKFGRPDYCKIDVEGYELQVLLGLSSPVPLISFEFTKEFEDRAASCVHRLEELGFAKFNVSYGESRTLKLTQFCAATELLAELSRARSPLTWGDIYAAATIPVMLNSTLVEAPQGNEDTLQSLYRTGVTYPGLPLKLHLGCGEVVLPDYVNIDYPQDRHNVLHVRPDYEGDLTSLRFPERSVDEIRLHHVFEHFSRVAALGLLILWYDWLRPGGALRIETPDFLATAQAFVRSNAAERTALVRHLEGDQAAAWAYHVGQWHPERFERTLSALGFDDVAIETTSTEAWHQPPLHNVTARAVKRREVPRAERLARAEELLRESLVSPAEEQTFQVWRRQLHAFLHAESTPPAPIAHAALAPDTASATNADTRALSEFRADHYVRHNQRRQEHLASLGLPLAERSVLELGAGIGDHTSFFLDRGCSVCVTEGRPDLVELLRRRYHWMRVERLDLEDPKLALNERFEIIYAYGLLYHLRDPVLAIRTMSRLCTDLLLLETCVAPDDAGDANVVPEDAELLSQAMSGFGCRPSRPFLLEALRGEFEHVYVTRTQPWHPEFPVEWPAPDGSGVLTRAVFVASRQPLEHPTLTSELPMRQERH
jgi:FkbM family methyltransferase